MKTEAIRTMNFDELVSRRKAYVGPCGPAGGGGKGLAMKARLSAIFCLLLLSCEYYTTPKLWEKTDPFARIWISEKDISEAELREKNIDYLKYDHGPETGYLVEKNDVQKLKDVAVRSIGMPVTLTIDATMTVAVVGVGVALACASDPECLASMIDLIVQISQNH